MPGAWIVGVWGVVILAWVAALIGHMGAKTAQVIWRAGKAWFRDNMR